jgi:hypothetical protein
VSNITGWSRGLEVSGGGRGVVSHAGLALLRHLADKTGLAGRLSAALATPRMLVHDRGRVLGESVGAGKAVTSPSCELGIFMNQACTAPRVAASA